MALPAALALVYHEREPYPRDVPLSQVYRHLEVPVTSGRAAVIVNMVQTLDGVIAVDGKAWSIGSAVDHYLFRTLRGWADAVLSGAGTLRLNDVIATTHPHLQAARTTEGRAPNPVAVVVSRLGEFSDEVLRKRFFTQRDFASIVVTTELARSEDRRRIEDAGAEVVVVPATSDGEVDLNAALGLLASRGLMRVLAEGGPHTNLRLFGGGLVDELFVTVVSTIVGAASGRYVRPGVLGGAWAELGLISEFQYRSPDVREWYLRFRVRRAGLPSSRSEPS